MGAAPPPAAAVTGAGLPRVPRLLVRLGSPAATPKPSGRSPGRPKGRASGPAVRYPAIKKATNKPRKKATKIAKAA